MPMHGPPAEPWDEHNQKLIAHVHPPDWKNPTPAPRYNLVVIGAGTAGLVTAAGAAGLGAKVALIERHWMGGDCLNVGCVPSKTLIRAARAAHEARQAGRFGIRVPQVEVDFAAVMERVRRVRASISPHDSAQRFRDLGVDVFLGAGRFISGNEIEVAGARLRFKRAVITTGARAAVPQIPGLLETGFLTNETVFNLTALPRRLAVIGGGPIGCELAQAFQRLGSHVTLFHNKAHVLDREDEDAARVVQHALARDGVQLILNARPGRIESSSGGKRIQFQSGVSAGEVTVDAIFVATGRMPNVESLGLEAASVQFDAKRGVRMNERLQTTNPRIYAAGDVCMKWKFTHAADFAARIVIQNALFLGRKKLSALNMPWTTYTDPEVAHVGHSSHEAESLGIAIDTFVQRFAKVDRAITEDATEGFVKVHVRRGSDKIVGVTIAAPQAGELISEISVAMAAGLGLGKLGNVIHPYPTLAEALRKCGDAYNRTRLTPRVKSLLGTWLRWTR